MRLIIGLFDIVIANEGEATAVAGGDLAAFWPTLRDRGVRMAVVTLGPRGARLFGVNEDSIIAAPNTHAIDTAGAGDVMVGTMVGLLAQGRDQRVAATTAVAAASLSVTRPSTIPSFPTHEEIKGLDFASGAAVVHGSAVVPDKAPQRSQWDVLASRASIARLPASSACTL